MVDKTEMIEEIDTKIKLTDTVRVTKFGNPQSDCLFAPIRKYLKAGLKIHKGDLIEITVRHTGIYSKPNPNLFGKVDKQMAEMEEKASI